MMMSIATSVHPDFAGGDGIKIMKAQMARGADFDNGNLIQKAKTWCPVGAALLPLPPGHDLAMEARCYRGREGRTKMKPLLYEKRDYIACAILGGLSGSSDGHRH